MTLQDGTCVRRGWATSLALTASQTHVEHARALYELGISETTARQHLSGLYRRTGCVNAAQAAYWLGAGAFDRWGKAARQRRALRMAPDSLLGAGQFARQDDALEATAVVLQDDRAQTLVGTVPGQLLHDWPHGGVLASDGADERAGP